MDDNIARLAELQEKEDGAERRPKQADVLIALANAAVLFHSPAPDCDAFADITVHGHRETHRIRGRAFRQWLRHQYFKKTKNGANSDALQVATETIAARATFEGDEHEVHCRIAGTAALSISTSATATGKRSGSPTRAGTSSPISQCAFSARPACARSPSR